MSVNPVRRVTDTGELVWGEPLAYLCDDRGEAPHEIVIAQGGNQDWYVSVMPQGDRFTEACVRLCTSGGASSAVPGLTIGIAKSYRALWEAVGGAREESAPFVLSHSNYRDGDDL